MSTDDALIDNHAHRIHSSSANKNNKSKSNDDDTSNPNNKNPPNAIRIEDYSVDLFWSFLSDSFFIAGGVAYIALTVWDFYLSTPRVNGDSSLSLSTTTSDISSSAYLYIALDVMAPSVYLCNSVVDMHWTTRVQQRLKEQHRDESESRCAFSQPPFTASSLSGPETIHHCVTPVAGNDDMNLRGFSFSSVSAIVEPRWSVPWWRKIGAHAAHRRTVAAALTFGLAASLAVVAALWRTTRLVRRHHCCWTTTNSTHRNSTGSSSSIAVDDVLDACSDHMYVASALISITGSRVVGRGRLAESVTAAKTSSLASSALLGSSSLPWYNDNERLEDWGDVLFLLGCVMDAALTDFQLKRLLILPIISSFLWLLDGCLYMKSDFVRSHRLHRWRQSVVQETERHGSQNTGVLV